MNAKKITAAFVAVVMMFSVFSVSCLAVSSTVSGPNRPSEFRRQIEGYAEMITRVISSAFQFRNNYSEYTELTDIPETENGYVPQGYCFSKVLGCHIVSAYHTEKASVLIFVDAESGERIKTVKLLKNNGENFTGHAGGIATDGVFVYVANGSKINRIPVAALFLIPDGSGVPLGESMATDVKCSYLSCDGEYLYAGEFYTFETDGGYDTDASHHVAISLFEASYSRCNAYKLENLNAFFGGADAVPEFVLSTPNKVQGFARTENGSFALATSFGRNNDSFLLIYDDVTDGEADYTVDYNGVIVPGYCFAKADRTDSRRLPPMLEGIDANGGKVTGIFESGAQKYSDSAFIVNSICEF